MFYTMGEKGERLMAYYPNNYYGQPAQGYTPNYQPQGNVYPPTQQTPATPQFNSARSVYSEAEARSAQIPTDGTTVFFTDQSNGRIYTKQFSFDNGSFIFNVYQRVEEQIPVRYATMADLQALRDEIMKGVKNGAE